MFSYSGGKVSVRDTTIRIEYMDQLAIKLRDSSYMNISHIFLVGGLEHHIYEYISYIPDQSSACPKVEKVVVWNIFYFPVYWE